MIAPKPGILDIAPYVGGESKAGTVSRIIKLSSNEGALGVPPAVQAALKEMAATAHRYPDGGCTALRERLADIHRIDADKIVCGAGSDEIISFLCQAYVAPGDEVIYSQHGFLMYSISAMANGGKPVAVAEKNLTADVGAMIAAVNDKTKIVFLANPNNPTGSYLSQDEVRRLAAGLPKDVLLVLDVAYAEFVTAPDYSAGHELVAEFGNVVVTQTFSKMYAMGGLRLGWGHCPPDVADVLNRVRGPFNVSSVAQVCGVAALSDPAFVTASRDHNTHWRGWMTDRLTSLGLKVYPSQGNFLLVDFGSPDRAENCRLKLKEQGILIRQMGAYGLPRCLRISIGAADEMEIAFSAISGYMNNP